VLNRESTTVNTNEVTGHDWRQKLNEQLREITLALLGEQLAEPERFSRPIELSIAARRWLDTKDHRGRVPRPDSDTACCPPLGEEARAYLRERGFSRSGEPARKRRETALSNDRPDLGDSENAGTRPSWFGRIIHPRWKQHLAEPDARSYLFQRARAQRIQNEFRIALHAVGSLYSTGARLHQPEDRLQAPTAKGWPKFNASLLSRDARKAWGLDQALDRIAARAARYNAEHWNSALANVSAADEQGRYDGAHRGWAPRVGAKHADKLLAIATARRRAEVAVEAHAFSQTATEQALDRLKSVIRRVTRLNPRSASRDEYLATLPHRIATELARREPAAYTWLAEADEDGATEIPARVVKAIGRCPLIAYDPRSLAADLTAALKGRAGDRQSIINVLAESAYGFQAARGRRRQRQIGGKVLRIRATNLRADLIQ
jgi:hypothetical protein